MKKQIANSIFLVFLSSLMLSLAFGQETSGYSITDFLSATFFNEVEVSPNARHVAFITVKDNFEKNKAETTIWKIDVDESGRKTGMSRLIDEQGEFSSLKWSSDGRFLAFKSTHKSLKPQLVIFDVRNKKSFLVTDQKKCPQGISAFDWSPDGKRIYFAAQDILPSAEKENLSAKSDEVVPFAKPQGAPVKSTFYRLAVTDFGQEAESFVSIEDTLVEFVLSPDEKTIAVRPQQGVFLLETTGKQSFRRLTPPFICFDPGMKWTSKGVLIRVCGGIKDGRMQLTQRRIYLVNPANGSLEIPAPDFTGEFRGQAELLDGGLLTIGAVSTKLGLYYIDPLTKKAKEVEPYLGAAYRLSVAKNGKLIAFSVVNNNHFQELYIASSIDRMSNATRVTDLNAKLNQMPKPEVETVRWNNNEGDVIEGILFYPPGKKGVKNLPFIVDIHGGPTSAMTESLVLPAPIHWTHYPALLASRGYLVLEPNFRGSTGRGETFMHALNGYICSRPVIDTLTGVDYIVSQGLADPERLGVIGASFGGAVTNCVIGQTTRFKAAVAHSGIWNRISHFGTTGGSFPTGMNGKTPWEDFKMYWEESGVSRAANIKTPTIITIGAEDRQIDSLQAKEQQRALNRLRVPNELLIFPGEGHGFSKPSNKRIKLEAEIAWFDHYILGKPLPKPLQD